MIEPLRWFIMVGATAAMPRYTPVWLMAMIESHRARSVSIIPAIRKIPALLINTSIRPSSARIELVIVLQAAASVTSCSTKVAPISVASFSPSATSTSVR